MVTIHLNGESREIESQIGLVGLLEHFDLPLQRVAVELNGTVIRRIDWPETHINHGDRIEVVHFVGGG